MTAIRSPQAPERDPETLEIFIEESLEALQRDEQLLLTAEAGHVAHDLMAVLFRDIHTIKGTSGFLSVDHILALSHVAEDMLSKLREGSLTPTPETYGRLLSVCDALRTMVCSLRDTDDEGDTDVAPLIALIRADLEPRRDVAKAPSPPPSLASIPGGPASRPAPKLGEILVAHGSITPHELEEALAEQHDTKREANGVGRAEVSDGTVRVNVAVLDKLMNLIGELVLARNQVLQIVRSSREQNINAQGACNRLNLVTSDLQEQIMKTRMQPIARVFEKIPRMVRDLCHTTGKQVVPLIEGTATEIDKALVEAIRDPVMHIVRNAVDHGIEDPQTRLSRGKSAAGSLTVRAAHEGGMVILEVEDDGKGMDPVALRAHAVKKGLLTAAEAERLNDREALELVFRPGFTTAAKVTDISGRGVGMDVVRTHVERAGGQVEIESAVGRGTCIRLKMPLTLAIIPALLVETGGQRFAIPQVSLLELVYLDETEAQTAIEHVRGAQIYRLRGEILPLVKMSTVLGIDSKKSAGGRIDDGINVVVVAVGARRYGIVVDAIHDTEEIVIKPLHGQLKRLVCYSGATVLGDGGVALILDVAGVAALAGIAPSTQRAAAAIETSRDDVSMQRFVVFRTGGNTQCAVPLAMVARLERLPRASIENVAGAELVQYRDVLMPLVRPETVLPLGTAAEQDEQAVIVFDFGQMIGMAVDTIVDVVEARADEESVEDAAPFTVGRAVIFGRTTLLIDVYRIVRELAPHFVKERRRPVRRSRVLVADDSNAMRAALSGYLRSFGLDVIDVANGDAAVHELRSARRGPIDAVITDLEMPGMDGFGVLAMLRKERPQIPAFVWTYHQGPEWSERAIASGARACIHKLERERLISELATIGIGATQREPADERRI